MNTKDKWTAAAAECLADGYHWDMLAETMVSRLPEIDAGGLDAVLPELIGSIGFYLGRIDEFTQSAPGLVDWRFLADEIITSARLIADEFTGIDNHGNAYAYDTDPLPTL